VALDVLPETREGTERSAKNLTAGGGDTGGEKKKPEAWNYHVKNSKAPVNSAREKMEATSTTKENQSEPTRRGSPGIPSC